MKKFLIILTAVLMLGLCGCGAEDASEETTVQPETEALLRETTAPMQTVPETTAPAEGFLFFTVSDITFSLEGEAEDIYVGTLPREAVTWTSEDESVALFQDGILTAAGVGSTVVSAEYGDQRLECKVCCLARTQEELDAMDSEILRAPKRMPPVVEEWPDTFYDDAAFIGDSITYTLWHTAGKTEGELLNSLFLVRGGTSLNGFVLNYKNIYYQGIEMKLDDAIAASGVKKAFFMMGQNDLGYKTIEETMENWTILLGRILEKSPDVEIYIQSLVPEWIADNGSNAKNVKIDQYNEELKVYCRENGYHFVDIAPYIEDHANKMASVYSMDQSIHINYDGTAVWMQALKAYALLEELKGEGL
ncbi:MAG: GDSL-type esterase/lipase family protein [Faecousia sp.]